MQKTIAERLDKYAEEGAGFTDDWQLNGWSRRVAQFLRAGLGEDIAREFEVLGDSVILNRGWDAHAMRLGFLEGHSAKIEYEHAPKEEMKLIPHGDSYKIFLVHGHDEAAKETVARYLEKLKLHPIILHEQPNSGRTVIEKFEKYSGDVGFAVVLLTPDDVGASNIDPTSLQPRARQNVVLELGYFLGKLTRTRVCALYKNGVDIPSDIQGVLYIEMDKSGAWKTKLAQELVQAKCPIDLSGLIAD